MSSLVWLSSTVLAAEALPDVPGKDPYAWGATGLVVGLLLAGLFVFLYMTRTGVIARATTKEAIRQPVFLLLLAMGALLLVVNTFLPFFSLGSDIKMLKDCGLMTLLFSALAAGGLDGQHEYRQRNRRQNDDDVAVEADQSATVHRG